MGGEMLAKGKERSRSIGSTWMLAYDFFDPAEEGLREALTSTGNGYFCTRGAAEWADADDVHYPGTYVHGGYNRETTIIAGRPVLNEDLVNVPNWLVFKLQIEDELIRLDDVELLSYRHELDIRNATVVRVLRFRDRAGRMSVISALDGRVTNRGVARYRQLEGRHLQPELTRTVRPDIIALRVQTRQSHIHIAQAARTRVYGEHEVVGVDRSLYQMEDYIHQVLTFEVEEKVAVRVEKMVALYPSRDHAINEPLANAIKAVDRYEPFAEAFERHARAWGELWSVCDMCIPKDNRVQLLIRLHISHVLQVCSPHTADLDAGVPARGLNGEAYRGHVFWDELYIYPFLDFRLPEITRELLMYRYRRLDEARAAAGEAGYRGAMYPWQSGSDGQEETQVVHLNPRSGRWERDLSHSQRHVGAAIFYNIWRYFQTTGDFEFLLDHGAEMMLEIARFWASIAHFNPDRDRYEIHGVMGPDEFHEKYPGSEEGGLRNNAYTNVMVAWICEIALEVLELLPERLRYEYAPDTLEKNISYYESRTSHGSTLSYVVHAAVLADLDAQRSWEMFMRALESDVGDIQGGTTREGIHMGVMAGTLDLIQRHYVGAKTQDTTICFDPKPNERLDGLSLHLRFHKTPVEVVLQGAKLTIVAQTDGSNRSVRVGVGDEVREIEDRGSHTFVL